MANKRKRTASGGMARESTAEYRVALRVSATEASRNFSEIMNRVRYRGETFIVERGGETICEIRPAAPTRFTGSDWMSLLDSLPPVDDDYLRTVEELARSQPVLPESPWRR